MRKARSKELAPSSGLGYSTRRKDILCVLVSRLLKTLSHTSRQTRIVSIGHLLGSQDEDLSAQEQEQEGTVGNLPSPRQNDSKANPP